MSRREKRRSWGNKERLPESSLVALIDAFNGLALNPEAVAHEALGQAYEYLLKNFADECEKKAGEFFTPQQVVRLIVQILDPQTGESIYDPAAGSGGMLVETINTIRAHGDTRTLRLYGQEVNLTTCTIARMNLFLFTTSRTSKSSGATHYGHWPFSGAVS